MRYVENTTKWNVNKAHGVSSVLVHHRTLFFLYRSLQSGIAIGLNKTRRDKKKQLVNRFFQKNRLLKPESNS